MELTIDRLGDNGEGIAIIPSGDNIGKVCFVEYALPQEIVDVEIIETTSKYCRAKIKSILQKSENRQCASCNFFTQCGGCSIQHIDRKTQLDLKKQRIANAFRRIAKISPIISDVVSCNDFGYRNKMVFPVTDINGQAVIGMYSNNTHDIVDINSCKIADNKINKALQITKDYFIKNNSIIYVNNQLLLKYIVIRCVNDSILVTLVVKDDFEIGGYFELLKSYFDLVGLSFIISDNGKDILGGKYIHKLGLEKIQLEEFGIKYSIDNRSFFQVNTPVKLKLYEEILSRISTESTVIDGYSGAGLLTAIISKKCKKAIGVEINKSASNSANILKEENNLRNVQFINSDFKLVVLNYLKNTKDMVILLDPPRAGCDKMIIDKIATCGAEKIIYVSCNPDSLARDIQRLGGNYKISKIIPFEMFPQTKHVETLAILVKV